MLLKTSTGCSLKWKSGTDWPPGTGIPCAFQERAQWPSAPNSCITFCLFETRRVPAAAPRTPLSPQSKHNNLQWHFIQSLCEPFPKSPRLLLLKLQDLLTCPFMQPNCVDHQAPGLARSSEDDCDMVSGHEEKLSPRLVGDQSPASYPGGFLAWGELEYNGSFPRKGDTWRVSRVWSWD